MKFEILFQFEQELARYTNAPFVVVTDGCTHGIELVMRYYEIESVSFSAYTYLSIPQTMQNLGIEFEMTGEEWQGEYQFHGTNIWDSARRLEPGMYRPGQIQVLSFGHTKPMDLGGQCGAILLDDQKGYSALSRMRSDGRDLSISPWVEQRYFSRGYHYCPRLESCDLGLRTLPNMVPQSQQGNYPDCRKISFLI